MLIHVVSFTFTDKTDAVEAKARLEALLPEIDPLLTLMAGVDTLGDPGAADLVLITTHDDVAGLRAYQQHPLHQAFGTWLGPRLAAKTVVDVQD